MSGFFRKKTHILDSSKLHGLTLTADVLSESQMFTIGSISITETSKEMMLMSEGYLANGSLQHSMLRGETLVCCRLAIY